MRRPLLPPSHVTRALFGLAGTALAGALVIDHFRAEPAPAPEPSYSAPPRLEVPPRPEQPVSRAVPFVVGNELPEASPEASPPTAPQTTKPRHAPPAPRPRKFVCGPCGMG